MTKLAQLIGRQEGYGKPGAVPTRNNNPGDLRHSPHSAHLPGDPDGIGIIDTAAHGWADLDRQLRIYAGRGLTIRQMVAIYAPPDENATAEYLDFICSGLACSPDDSVASVLEIPAA